MWRAMAAQTGLQVMVLGAAVARFDWEAEARRAELGVLEGARSMGNLGEALMGEGGEGSYQSARPAAPGDGSARRSTEGKVAFPHSRQGVYEPPISSLLD